ncbi:MAG: glycosyltransferase family 39 protein [Phycisphaerae bacterium]|nr:glycosyltransferase family 39 protein [Phycisphaerae bacterium]
MIALKVLFAVLLLCGCGLGPGLVIVRRFRGWWPLERLCAAVGLSLLVIYLAAAVIYGVGWSRWACYVVSGVCLVLLAVGARDLYGMLRSVRVRRALLWFGLLEVWCLAALATIRNYGGGGWGGDWLEHYQRCLFFLNGLPSNTLFLDLYSLPARPPMMNLLGAFVMTQAGTDFEVYQVVFLVLNSLIFLPCALLASYLARGGGRRVGLAAILFALNPMFIENVTYPWTKLLGAFYTVLAVWVYLRAIRKNDSGRLVLAAAFLATGVLVHYSAAVFLLVLGAHYFLFAFRKRRRKWRETMLGAATGAVILATWLGWSIHAYGWKATFTSNTAVSSASAFSGWGNVAKIGSNVLHTVLPHPLFSVPQRAELLRQSGAAGYWRDYSFMIYQTNAILAMGCVGGILVLALLAARLARKGIDRELRWFWLTFVAGGFLVGIAVVGEKDYYGLAHLCLQPMIFIGVTFLALNLPSLRLAVLGLWAVGTAFDFAVGILLHLSVENLTLRQILMQDNLMVVQLDKLPINFSAQENLRSKIVNDLRFWGDRPVVFFQVALAAGCVLMLGWILTLARTRRAPAPSGAGEGPTDTTSGSAAATPGA